MLQSRKINPDEFIKEFFDHLKYGVILRKDFIAWQKIFKKTDTYKEGLKFISSFKSPHAPKQLKENLRDSLLSSDNPYVLIKSIFELFGHTASNFCLFDDYFDITKISKEIQDGNFRSADYISQLFIDLGMEKILSGSIKDTFLGVQIGLETHRRKNIGGTAFKNLVGEELNKILSQLKEEINKKLELKSEQNIFYRDGTNKKTVDFLLSVDSKPRLGFEINFYTVSGSKPTEIKRSYAEVARQLKDVSVDLVWITDGKGYFDMKRSLKEAFGIHPNTYNYWMVKEYLFNDILDFLRNK